MVAILRPQTTLTLTSLLANDFDEYFSEIIKATRQELLQAPNTTSTFSSAILYFFAHQQRWILHAPAWSRCLLFSPRPLYLSLPHHSTFSPKSSTFPGIILICIATCCCFHNPKRNKLKRTLCTNLPNLLPPFCSPSALFMQRVVYRLLVYSLVRLAAVAFFGGRADQSCIFFVPLKMFLLSSMCLSQACINFIVGKW